MEPAKFAEEQGSRQRVLERQQHDLRNIYQKGRMAMQEAEPPCRKGVLSQPVDEKKRLALARSKVRVGHEALASVTSGIEETRSLAVVGNGGAKWSPGKRKDLGDQRGCWAAEAPPGGTG